MASQNLGRVVGSKIYAGNATDNSTIATDLAGRSITPLVYDIYISSNKDIFQYQLVENNPMWVLLMNIKGEAGTFKISKTYSSVAAMEAGYATDTLPVGALVVIETGDANNTDNAKLYVKGDTQYNFLTDMSGTQGIQGPKGDQGIQGNTGETGATFTPSVDANGNISWTNDKGLNNPTTINIKGDKGDKGDTGANGKTPTLTINANGELVSTIED